MKNQKHLRKEKNNNKDISKAIRKEVKSIVKAQTGSSIAAKASSKVIRATINAVKGAKMSQQYHKPAAQTKGDIITVAHACTVENLTALDPATWAPTEALVTPSNSFLFPLLSNFTAFYEKFRFEEVTLTYEPSVSTMQAAGFVYMDMMENPDEIVYDSETSMSDSGALRIRPDKPLVMRVQCCKDWMFCQNAFTNGLNTLTDYAMCKLVWASFGTGLTVGTALGKIKMTAKISFMGVRLPGNVKSKIVGYFSQAMSGVQLDTLNSAGDAVVPFPIASYAPTITDVVRTGLLSSITFGCTVAGQLFFTIPTVGWTRGATIFINIAKATTVGNTCVALPGGLAADIPSQFNWSGPNQAITHNGYCADRAPLAVSPELGVTAFNQHPWGRGAIIRFCRTFNASSYQPMTCNFSLNFVVPHGSLATDVLYVDAYVVDYGGDYPAAESP